MKLWSPSTSPDDLRVRGVRAALFQATAFRNHHMRTSKSSGNQQSALSKKRRAKSRRHLCVRHRSSRHPAERIPDIFPRSARLFFVRVPHQSRKSAARVGRIHTPHGVVDTPSFVGVATNGAFEALDRAR